MYFAEIKRLVQVTHTKSKNNIVWLVNLGGYSVLTKGNSLWDRSYAVGEVGLTTRRHLRLSLVILRMSTSLISIEIRLTLN